MRKERLGYQVVQELRERRDNPPKIDYSIIDLVWVLSAPGTPLEPAQKGIFAGRQLNHERIVKGLETVKKATASKLGIEPDDVTKEDIHMYGPKLLYNGEDSSNGESQNEDMAKYMNSRDFPLPKTQVIIRDLEEIYSPGQIKDLVSYLDENPDIKNIAVVTHSPHSRRTARYPSIPKYLFPQHITFTEICVPEEIVPVGSVIGEIHRIEKYEPKGDLSKTPAF